VRLLNTIKATLLTRATSLAVELLHPAGAGENTHPDKPHPRTDHEGTSISTRTDS